MLFKKLMRSQLSLRISLGVFAVLILALISPHQASAVDSSASQFCESFILGGGGSGDNPFPFSSVRKLPWTKIDGDWQTLGDVSMKFTFRVLKTLENGTKFVLVSYINEKTGQVVSHGVGEVRRDGRVVRVHLAGARRSMELKISARDILGEKNSACYGKRVLVVTAYMTNLSGDEVIKKIMILKKTSDGSVLLEKGELKSR